MTFRERLQMEHPKKVGEKYDGGCEGCPEDYGYEKIRYECSNECEECWNREVSNAEPIEYCDKCGYIKAQCECEEDVSFTDDLINQGYNKGLNDAWELAIKIIDDMSEAERYEIFGCRYDTDVMKCITPQEALAKLKAYEEQSKIEVGDVFLIYGEEAVVTRVVDEHANILFGDGVTNNMPVKDLLGDKTGKHIDIKSFLEQIGE